MNVYCRLVSLSIVVVAAAALGATPEPQRTQAGGNAPLAVSFSVAPIHFPVDGKEHRPNLVVWPAGATYVIEGTISEKEPGTYIFTVKGTGSYAGSMTCRWTIDPPKHRPRKKANPAPQTIGVSAQ